MEEDWMIAGGAAPGHFDEVAEHHEVRRSRAGAEAESEAEAQSEVRS
jgi:hypothetical protein